jgi:putative hydrolase of the HAD superfamily
VNGCLAVVFDLDDTLYPEREYVLSGFRAVAAWAETNLNIPAEKGVGSLNRLFSEGVRGDTFNRWLSLHQVEPKASLIDKLVHIYRSHEPKIKPFPEVPTLLSVLKKKYRLGLTSDGHLSVQQSKLNALRLASLFDAIVFSDQWGRDYWKPSTKPFEILLGKLAIEGKHAVYVGDNPVKDFLGARRLGMTTVWVRRPEGEYSHLTPPSDAHAPHFIFSSLFQLISHLKVPRHCWNACF